MVEGQTETQLFVTYTIDPTFTATSTTLRIVVCSALDIFSPLSKPRCLPPSTPQSPLQSHPRPTSTLAVSGERSTGPE